MSEQEKKEQFSKVTRRKFLRDAGIVVGGTALSASLLAACGKEEVTKTVQVPTTVTTTVPGTTITQPPVTSTVTGIDWLGQPKAISASEINETISTEVVVVGGGHAGQFAACAAAEEGADVVLLECQEHFEAHSFQYGGIDAKICKDLGINVDPVDVLRAFLKTNPRINVPLVSNLVHNVGPTFDWWYELFTDEVKDALAHVFWPLPEHYDPSRDLHPHYPSGIDFGHEMYIKAIGLVEQRSKDLGVTFRYKTRGDQLVKSNDGRITGIIAEKADGGYLKINASKGVIIATAGWMQNADMQYALNPAGVWCKDKFGGEYKNAWQSGMDWTKSRRLMGDGIKMACWAGGWMQPEFAASKGAEMAIGITVTPVVNNLGKRFMNEERTCFEGGAIFPWQPDGVGWAIFDSNWRSWLPYNTIGHRNLDDKEYPPLPEYFYSGSIEVRGSLLVDQIEDKLNEIVDDPAGVGRCVLRSPQNYGASSLDKLADFMGFTGTAKTNFLATIDRWNELARNGKDVDMGVDPVKMFEIKTPPFFASKMQVTDIGTTALHSTAGVMTDEYCRVTDINLNPIEGLWAVGDVQGGRWNAGETNPVACMQNNMAQAAGRLAGKMAATGQLVDRL